MWRPGNSSRDHPMRRSRTHRGVAAMAIVVIGAVFASLACDSADGDGLTAPVPVASASATASPSRPARAQGVATPTGTPTISNQAPASSRTPQPAPTPPAATPSTTPATSEAAATATQSGVQPASPATGDHGTIAALYLESAGIDADWPLEAGDTVFANGVEYFADPTAPQRIMWYPRFSDPGAGAANTVMAAHVNYVGFGNGPFAYLLDAEVDDSVHLAMADGSLLTYSVKSVTLHRLAEIDMNAIVFPALDSHIERVTLISCGGTFIPAASGYGGEYDSRVVLVAERYVS